MLEQLVRALKGRSDEKSIGILIALLKHPSETVRYWAANTAKDNLPELLKSIEIDTLIKQSLEYGQDSKQSDVNFEEFSEILNQIEPK